TGKRDRVAPGPRRIAGYGNEIASGINCRAHHVEDPVVMTDGGREQAARDPETVEIKFPRTIDHVADLTPVNQIAAFENRDAGEVREGGVDEIVGVADACDTRVGMEARQHRVAVSARRQGLLERPIVAGVFKPVEVGSRCLGYLESGSGKLRAVRLGLRPLKELLAVGRGSLAAGRGAYGQSHRQQHSPHRMRHGRQSILSQTRSLISRHGLASGERVRQRAAIHIFQLTPDRYSMRYPAGAYAAAGSQLAE